MRSKLSLVILPILVTMVSIPLCAQQRPKQSWNNLNQLQAGQKIEMVQMDMKSLKGRFLGFSEEAISVRVKKDEVAVARADVLRVTLRENPKRLRNVLIGAAIGGGVAAFTGGIIIRYCGNEGGRECPKLIALSVGIPIGAGAGIGAGSASYQTIYRATGRQRSIAP